MPSRGPWNEPSEPGALAALGQQWVGLLQQIGALHDPRRLRTLWLNELTLATDRYLRSTPFLQLMQFNLGALTRATRLAAPLGHR